VVWAGSQFVAVGGGGAIATWKGDALAIQAQPKRVAGKLRVSSLPGSIIARLPEGAAAAGLHGMLLDPKGKARAAWPRGAEGAEREIAFPTAGLVPGLYYLRLETAGKSYSVSLPWVP
jgi:hypothetical protein